MTTLSPATSLEAQSPAAAAKLPEQPQGYGVQELLGAVSRSLPLEAIGQALEATGKQSQRKRKLPAELVVQWIVALGLVSNASSCQVLGYLWPPDKPLPTKSSLSKARYRLGPRPLAALWRQSIKPAAAALSPQQAPWAFYQGLRIMSVDATCLEVPDTPRNERFFKRKGATRPDKRESAFPLAQIVGWLDSGQRLLCDLLIRSCRCGEQGPGLTLIRRRAEPGQIILWDCGFSGVHALAKACQEKGAHFLGRIRSNVYRQAAGVLSDGSYLVWLEPGEGSSPRDKPMLARIIEYKFGADGQRIRIITDLLHELAYPAEELAALYRERWEIENVFDEFKTHLLQGRPAGKATAIRAQRPAGVVQEIDGLALAHRVVRALMAAAAAATRQKLDPDRLSFTNSLGALRRPCPKSLRPRSKR
jgi:hypothetical protein